MQARQAYSLLDLDSGELSELDRLIATTTPPSRYEFAEGVEREIVMYSIDTFEAADRDPVVERRLLNELASVLGDGSGVFVVRNAVARELADQVTAAFEKIIAAEQALGVSAGDHFAAAGTNIRVWNALEKLAVRNPKLFVDYYSTKAISLASKAWLGPGYQVTSQLNVVNPGASAQKPHRDYHLGFMSGEQAIRFPAHIHEMSAMLTLQGAIAHTDMTVESGPTKVLPHSQKFVGGYVACYRTDVTARFESSFVQLPLALGDAIFFNPAVLHAAGSNTTDSVRRMGNLLQIGSAFGRTLESVDRTRTVLAIYDELRDRVQAGSGIDELDAAIGAAAEGYPFPTNLDRDPPIDGLAPPSPADLVRAALEKGDNRATLAAALSANETRRQPDPMAG